MFSFFHDLDLGPNPDEESDDMFEAIAPSPSSSNSGSGKGENRDTDGPKGGQNADDPSSGGSNTGFQAGGSGSTGTRSRIGARMVASIEGDLVEVPEVADPLIRILDQFVEDTLSNMQAGIVEFARLAKQHLEAWGLDVPANEAARFERLAVVPADPAKLHESLDDLAVGARFLARVRPEEYVDAGSWRLYRNVRKALRSDKIDFLAMVCHDLTEAVEQDPNHLQRDYLPRIEQRYSELVVREIERLQFILDIAPDSAEAHALAHALAEIDKHVGGLEDLHRKHPHPKLGSFLDQVETRRKQILPRLIEQCEAGAQQADFERVVYLLGALELLDPTRPSGEALAPSRAKLKELLAGLEQELRDMVAEALGKSEPAPAWRVLHLLEALPEDKRAAGSEFGKLIDEVRAHYEQQLATLTSLIEQALSGEALEPVDEALQQLEALLVVVPEHELAPKKSELMQHKQELLEAIAREERIRAAYQELAEQLEALRRNGEASLTEAETVLKAIDADTIVPAELKQPLRDSAQARHDQLAGLHGALAQETTERVDEKRQAADALMSEEDRATLAPLIKKVTEHRGELAAIEEQLELVNSLKSWLVEAEETEGPKKEAERVGASVKKLHTSQRHAHPGSIQPREALGKGLRMMNRIRHDLDILAATPAKALEALGPFNPQSLEAAEAPRFAAAQTLLEEAQQEAKPTLEHAERFAVLLEELVQDCGRCQEQALAWHEMRGRMEGDLAAGRVRAGHQKEIRELLEAAGDARAPFERLDAYVGAEGRVLAWYEAQRESLTALSERVDTALEVRAKRLKRTRNAVLTLVLLALLVAGGIYGWGLYQEHLREQRATELHAQAEQALEANEPEPVATALTESRAFLAEGDNEEEYGGLFADLLEQLEERQRLFAGLDEEMQRLREAAAQARERRAGYLEVRDRVVEFRERAMPRHQEELEELRLDMLLGHVEVVAEPGLGTERVSVVAQALADTEQRLAEHDDEALTALAQPLLDDLQEHQRELRLAMLHAIAEPGLEADSLNPVEAAKAELRDELAEEPDSVVREVGERLLRELRAHEVALRIAELEALAQPGFETENSERVAEVEDELAAVVAVEEHEEVVAAGEGLLERLQAHWVEVRITELEALAEPGFDAASSERVAELQDEFAAVVAAEEQEEVVAAGEELLERLQAHWVEVRITELEALAQPGLEAQEVPLAEQHETALVEALEAEENEQVVEALASTRQALREHILNLMLGELREVAEAALVSEDMQQIQDALATLAAGRETLEEPELRGAVDRYRERLEERLQWLLALEQLAAHIAEILEHAEATPQEVLEGHSEVRAALEQIEAPSEELQPQESLAEPLADLATREELLVIADEALGSDTLSALEEAHSLIESALQEERGEMHRDALAPYLEQIAERIAEIRQIEAELDRLLAQLIEQAEQLQEAEALPPLEDWLERARAFHEEADTARAEQLAPWIERIEARHALVAEAIARYQEVVAQAEAALAQEEELAPIESAHDEVHSFLDLGEPLPGQLESLEQWRSRLAEALFERTEARGLASESSAEILEIAEQLSELSEQLPDPASFLERVEPARERLQYRAAYFAERDAIRERQAELLAGTDPLEVLVPSLEELDERIEALEETDTASELFGEAPADDAGVAEAQGSLRIRENLMRWALQGIEFEDAQAVSSHAREMREGLAEEEAARVHEPALEPYLALLDQLARLYEEAAAGLELEVAAEVRALIDQLEAELSEPEAEPLREPMEDPLDRLRQYAEVLEHPDRYAELTLEGPEASESRQATVTGTIAGAPLEVVYLYINGHEQRVAVEEEAFEAPVILRTGDNSIVASPVDSPNHPNAVEIEIVGNFDSSVVTVMLTWDTATDLDLRVVEPDGTEISWRRRIARGLHGRLDVDEREYGPENYSFTVGPGEQMPEGEYRIYVDYFEGDEPANWELNIVWYEDTPDELTIHLTGHIDPAEDGRNLLAYTLHVDENGRLIEEADEENDEEEEDEAQNEVE